MSFEHEDWLRSKQDVSPPPTEGIHFIHKKEEKEEEGLVRDETIYTIIGKQEYLEAEEYPCLDITVPEALGHKDAHAIKISIGDRTKYYIKRGRNGRVFNPIGIFSEGTGSRQLKHAGKPMWDFTETKQEIFDLYINFLLTKNITYLKNAERQLI